MPIEVVLVEPCIIVKNRQGGLCTSSLSDFHQAPYLPAFISQLPFPKFKPLCSPTIHSCLLSSLLTTHLSDFANQDHSQALIKHFWALRSLPQLVWSLRPFPRSTSRILGIHRASPPSQASPALYYRPPQSGSPSTRVSSRTHRQALPSSVPLIVQLHIAAFLPQSLEWEWISLISAYCSVTWARPQKAQRVHPPATSETLAASGWAAPPSRPWERRVPVGWSQHRLTLSPPPRAALTFQLQPLRKVYLDLRNDSPSLRCVI